MDVIFFIDFLLKNVVFIELMNGMCVVVVIFEILCSSVIFIGEFVNLKLLIIVLIGWLFGVLYFLMYVR